MAQTLNVQPNTTPQASIGNSQFASLYVGDLGQDVTEAMLYEVFSPVGPVASIRVCRDSVTRRSLGYAYVNFHAIADAERALDTLNYSNVKGRACRIMWSHRDPAIRRSGNGNVFVKNMDKAIDNKALYDAFSPFGNILSCKVASDADGKSRGFGFVHYEGDDSAAKAIAALNGNAIGNTNKLISCCIFRKMAERENSAPKHFSNVYVKHIPNHWDDAKLNSVFAEFGDITSMCINVDAKGRRFAFINYKDFDSARAAVEDLNGKDFRNEDEKIADEENERLMAEKDGIVDTKIGEHPEYLLYVSRAQTKGEREAELKSKFASTSTASPIGTNLYVKNISEDIDDEALKALFGIYGTILSAKVMRDERGTSKGFGFVCFASTDDASKATAEMHLKLMNGKPLYVGLHEKREQRIERLQSRYQVAGGVSMQNQLNNRNGMNMTHGGFNQMYGHQQVANNLFNQPGMVNRAPLNMGRPLGQTMFNGYPGAAQMTNRYPGQIPPTVMNTAMTANYNPMLANRNIAAAAAASRPRTQGIMQNQQMQMPSQQQSRPMQQQLPAGMNNGLGQYQFNTQARNPMAGPNMQPNMMPQMNQMTMQRDPVYDMSAGAPLTAAALASAPPGLQKQMLGEKIYPSIQRIQPELAGKITGMMLEMDNSELLILLESEQQLRAKVQEAMRVLENRQ